MRLIDFKQYLKSYISITLKDKTVHAGFVSNPNAFYSLPNDAQEIPDIRLMNGLMLDIVRFDDIDYIEEADREDTISLKMIMASESSAEVPNEPEEESDFEKIMDSLKRLVIKGNRERPLIEKAVLLSKAPQPVNTISRQQLVLDHKGNVQVISYHSLTDTTDIQNVTIDEETAQSILSLLYDCDSYEPVSKKEGSFKLSLHLSGYPMVKIYGPLNGSACSNETNLSKYLQERIPLESLLLFG